MLASQLVDIVNSPGVGAAAGAIVVNAITSLSMRRKVKRIEAKLNRVFRLLLQLPTLTPMQQGLVEQLLTSDDEPS